MVNRRMDSLAAAEFHRGHRLAQPFYQDLHLLFGRKPAAVARLVLRIRAPRGLDGVHRARHSVEKGFGFVFPGVFTVRPAEGRRGRLTAPAPQPVSLFQSPGELIVQRCSLT
jgi:hypothetical protein